jgi:hypothetical protein
MDRRARPDGWERRLIDAMGDARARPWAWGSHDCVTFAFRTAGAMLGGPTVWHEWAGRHCTAWGAARLLRSGGGLLAMLDRGADRIAPAVALRGDVAAFAVGSDRTPEAGGVLAVGVVVGSVIWCAASPRGLRAVPLSAAVHAWPVDE